MISPEERQRMYQVPMIGEEMVINLERIGISKIEDLKGRTPNQVIDEVNQKAGHKALAGPMAVMAITNLIDVADGRKF